MERLNTVAFPGVTSKFRDDQVATRATWDKVPDPNSQLALVHTITQMRKDATTVTEVNPLDPGDGGWHPHPDTAPGTVISAGRY